jgi:hypothetical protein
VTRTVKEKLPCSVGAPVKEPPAESDIPAGRLPEITDHVYPGAPFSATRVSE